MSIVFNSCRPTTWPPGTLKTYPLTPSDPVGLSLDPLEHWSTRGPILPSLVLLFFENVHIVHLVKKPEAEYRLLGFTLVKAASKVLPKLVHIMQIRASLDFVNCRARLNNFEGYRYKVKPPGKCYLYILSSSMIFSPGLGRQFEKMCENFLNSSKSFWSPMFELMAS